METTEKERKLKMPSLSFGKSGNSANSFDPVIEVNLRVPQRQLRKNFFRI